MADVLTFFVASEVDDTDVPNAAFIDDNDDLIVLAAAASFMRRSLNHVNCFFEDTIPTYLAGEFQSHFRMTRETFELLLQEVMHTGLIPMDNQSTWKAYNTTTKASLAIFVDCGK